MSVVQLDIVWAKIFDVNPTTGALENGREVPVYGNTLKLEEPAANKTRHKQSGRRGSRKVINISDPEKVSFQIMDGDPDNAKEAVGGTVTTVGGKKTWHKPKINGQSQVVGFQALTVDGYLYTINKGDKTGRKSFDFSDTGIALFDVEIEEMETGFEDISNVTWAQQ